MALYSSSTRSKSLMEVLLAKKIEAASQCNPDARNLLRTDSLDSMSSIGSLGSIILGDDVCRCDDCLLGIVDLCIVSTAETIRIKKKVSCIHFAYYEFHELYTERYPNFMYLQDLHIYSI